MMRQVTLEQKRANTTQQIMDAAISIFAKAGFAGARMDDSAKEAGVNKAPIYYHIGAPIMMRELASGGMHLPELAVRDLVRIANVITTILDEGVARGVFIQADPIVIHMMIIGTIAFYATGQPVRSKVAHISEAIKKPDQNDQNRLVKEIEKLVLRAVKK